MIDDDEIIIPYVPSPKQELFHRDRYKKRYRAIFAGTGAGKTRAGVFEAVSWALDNPGSVGYIFEPTNKMISRIIIPTLRDLLGKNIEANPLIKQFNKSEGNQFLEFINGSIIWFGSLERPEMAEGPNVDFIMIDEARLVRDFFEAWDAIRRRLRGSQGKKYPRGAWITTTPDMPTPYDEKTRTGSYLFSLFENPETRLKNSGITRMSIYDNPHLDDVFLDDIKMSHTEGRAERFIYGRFAEIGIGSFEFDSTIHILKGELLKLVTDKTMTFKKFGYGQDFGWTNPCCSLAIGMDNDNRAYILEEFYQSRARDEDRIKAQLAMQKSWAAYDSGIWYCDPSNPQAIMMMREAGMSAVGNKVKREDGIRDIGSRLLVAGDGRPRLYIHPSCVNTISEFQTYLESKKERDHAVDAARYAIANMRDSGMGGYSRVRASKYKIRR